MKCGIYAIFNSKSGKIYIGQSRNLESRKYSHFHALELGKHHNKYLQRAYDADGAENFSFIVLEECTVDDLDSLETKYIERFCTMDSALGYNLESGGNVGKDVSEAVREAKRGKNNPMYGKRISKEHVEILRIKNRGHNSALTETDVANIKKALADGVRVNDVCARFNASRAVITKIKTGKNFYWVAPELNEQISEEYIKRVRDEKIKSLDAEGFSRSRIAKTLGITPATVARVLNKPSSVFYKNNPQKMSLAKQVERDFKQGIGRDEIMKKYGINACKYVKYISAAYNEKMEEEKRSAIEMRKSGMMVKDIAERLGRARTTITRWTFQVK